MCEIPKFGDQAETTNSIKFWTRFRRQFRSPNLQNASRSHLDVNVSATIIYRFTLRKSCNMKRTEYSTQNRDWSVSSKKYREKKKLSFGKLEEDLRRSNENVRSLEQKLEQQDKLLVEQVSFIRILNDVRKVSCSVNSAVSELSTRRLITSAVYRAAGK